MRYGLRSSVQTENPLTGTLQNCHFNMINPDTIGGPVKYLNTPENENYFLSKGYRLPSRAPKDRFDTYKWIYVSYGWIRGMDKDFDEFPTKEIG